MADMPKKRKWDSHLSPLSLLSPLSPLSLLSSIPSLLFPQSHLSSSLSLSLLSLSPITALSYINLVPYVNHPAPHPSIHPSIHPPNQPSTQPFTQSIACLCVPYYWYRRPVLLMCNVSACIIFNLVLLCFCITPDNRNVTSLINPVSLLSIQVIL